MGRKKIVVAIIFISLLISCSSLFKNYYTNKDGGNRPKNSKFTLAKTPYIVNKDDLIDTNAVYINTSKMYYDNKEHIDYHYLRFFKNGRYFEDLVSTKEELNVSNFNNVNNALMIGYFKIQNNKLLELEYFRVKYGEGGFYDKRQGYIRNDSIFLFYESYKNNDYPIPNNRNCRIYIKKEVEGLNGTPDW
ncbi:hypothetical protein [Lacinutrix chionoecetis]